MVRYLHEERETWTAQPGHTGVHHKGNPNSASIGVLRCDGRLTGAIYVLSVNEVSGKRYHYRFFLRKEVIQPQVPLRLPCYDFTPVADPTVVSLPPCG